MRFGLFLDADGVAVALVDVGELVGVDPRVEDPEVVVGGDEGDQAGDGHRRLVLLVHRAQAQPEEEGRRLGFGLG